MINKYLWFIFLLIIQESDNIYLNGQDRNRTDSLLQLMKSTSLSDSILVNIYFGLAQNHPNYREALYYANETYKLAEKLDKPRLMAKGLIEVSNKQRLLGNTVASYNAIFRALKIYKKLNNSNGIAILHSQLAANYIIDNDYINAKKYYKEALYEFNQLGKIKHMMQVKINLGEAYRHLNELDSAEMCFKDILESADDSSDNLIRGYAIGNLGLVHSEQNDLDSADYELTKAIALLETLGDAYSVSVYMAELAKIYEKEGNIIAAEAQMVSALQLARNNGLKEQVRDISEKLADLYARHADYKKALEYQRLYQVYQDSLVNRANIEKTEQLKNQYELEKKETQINFLNQVNKNQRIITYGSGGGAALLLILAFFLYRNYKRAQKANHSLEIQKKEIEKREEEKALLLKELNHRVKNNLQMVSSLLSLQSHQLKDHPAAEAIKAGRYRVEAMSLIHQKLYQKDHHTQIQLKDYVEELVRNLMYSSGQKAELIFTLEDTAVDINIAIPIALIVNELVTNAFKYAYENIERPMLEINLYKKDGLLNLFIKDNGKGIVAKHDPGSYSFGLKLVHSLVDQIDGEIEQFNDDGSCWHLKVKVPV